MHPCIRALTFMHHQVEEDDLGEGVELGFEMEHPVRPSFLKAMKRYIALHRRILAQDPKFEQRFVVAAPSGQLCNRIRGIVSAFTLAFLTDRAFVMQNFGYGETRYGDLFLSPGFDIENTQAVSGIESKVFTMHGGDVKTAELFTCSDWSKVEVPVVHLPGASYINTYLYRNPYLQDKLAHLYLDDDMYRPILFWLFRPRQDIVKAKDDFIRKNFRNSNLITFHIRTSYPVTVDEFQAYRNCASAVIPPFVRNASWFVATDGDAARRQVLQELSPNAVFYSPDKFVTGDGLYTMISDHDDQ
jgi:hypothetical protein